MDALSNISLGRLGKLQQKRPDEMILQKRRHQ